MWSPMLRRWSHTFQNGDRWYFFLYFLFLFHLLVAVFFFNIIIIILLYIFYTWTEVAGYGRVTERRPQILKAHNGRARREYATISHSNGTGGTGGVQKRTCGRGPSAGTHTAPGQNQTQNQHSNRASERARSLLFTVQTTLFSKQDKSGRWSNYAGIPCDKCFCQFSKVGRLRGHILNINATQYLALSSSDEKKKNNFK